MSKSPAQSGDNHHISAYKNLLSNSAVPWHAAALENFFVTLLYHIRILNATKSLFCCVHRAVKKQPFVDVPLTHTFPHFPSEMLRTKYLFCCVWLLLSFPNSFRWWDWKSKHFPFCPFSFTSIHLAQISSSLSFQWPLWRYFECNFTARSISWSNLRPHSQRKTVLRFISNWIFFSIIIESALSHNAPLCTRQNCFLPVANIILLPCHSPQALSLYRIYAFFIFW